MLRSGMVATLGCFMLGAALGGTPIKWPPTAPKFAVGDFTSSNYAVTFRAPEHAYYCPLPENWEGSDHGTVVFFTKPKACYGAGYPSSDRGFEPGDVPRIEIYYGYDLDQSEGDQRPPRCHSAGTALLFGKSAPLCEETNDGLAIITARGHYTADQPAMLSVTLVVSPADVPRFFPTFKTVLSSARPCRAKWEASDDHGRIVNSGYTGHVPACPAGKWY